MEDSLIFVSFDTTWAQCYDRHYNFKMSAKECSNVKVHEFLLF